MDTDSALESVGIIQSSFKMDETLNKFKEPHQGIVTSVLVPYTRTHDQGLRNQGAGG